MPPSLQPLSLLRPRRALPVLLWMVVLAGSVCSDPPSVDECLRRLAEPREDPQPWLARLIDLPVVPETGVPIFARLLSDKRALVRRQAAVLLKRLGPKAVAAVPTLCQVLQEADGKTESADVAAYLDALRGMGSAGRGAADTIATLLPERSHLYRDRDKLGVSRLRAYLLLTLADIGVPKSSIPHLIDALANVDPHATAFEVGAAVRAAGSLESSGRTLAVYLLAAIERPLIDDRFSLERYEPVHPASEATSVRLEVVRSLGRIRPVGNDEALKLLRAYAAGAASAVRHDPRLVTEAGLALKVIQGKEKKE